MSFQKPPFDASKLDAYCSSIASSPSRFDLPQGKRACGRVQVVDLFSGCGGLSAGFEHFARSIESFRLAAAVDLVPTALATYSKNLPGRAICADLCAAASSPRRIREFIASLDLNSSRPLVLVGGPPCQGFSAHRKKSRIRSDERNGLVLAFAKIAVALEPEFIVLENVPELVSEKNWPLFCDFRSRLRKVGYFVRAQVHNLADYGVPQERFRALIVARKSPFRLPTPLLQRSQFRTVRDAIASLKPVAPGERGEDPMHFCANHKASTVAVIKAVPKNGGSRPAGIGPRCLQQVDGFRDVYGRMYWDRPANTITANSRNPAGGRFIHPDQDRGLTVREAALLQGFPKRYSFVGSFDDQFLQIGNAVPSIFGAALAASIWSNIVSPPKSFSLEELATDVTEPVSNSFSSGIAGRKKSKAA